jgi:hypothetical protein
MTREAVAASLNGTYAGLPEAAAMGAGLRARCGMWCKAGTHAPGASDRISAFDRVLSTIPFKGEILNRVSAGWFERTSDIVPNHVLALPTWADGTPWPRPAGPAFVRRAEMVNVEVLVRGFLTAPRGGLRGGPPRLRDRSAPGLPGIRFPEPW